MYHMHVRTELANSLYDLLTGLPITAISIQKITEHCGVSRRTFYHYFKDKYDLMAYMLYSRGEQLWYRDGTLCSFEEYYERHIRFEHLPVQVLRNMYEYVGQNDLREYLIRKARRDLKRAFYFSGKEQLLERKDLQDIIDLLSYGLAAMFEHYVRDLSSSFPNLDAMLNCFPEEYHEVLRYKPPKDVSRVPVGDGAASRITVPAFDSEVCDWPPDMF